MILRTVFLNIQILFYGTRQLHKISRFNSCAVGETLMDYWKIFKEGIDIYGKNRYNIFIWGVL